MRHGLRQNTRAAILGTLSSCIAVAATAQTGLQHPLLRTSSPATTAAEHAAPAPCTSVAAALQQLASQAAVIFTGSVVAVTADTSGGAQVKFTVEQGIRAARSGAGYTAHISSWAGGSERFYPGERALFLFSAPSASGYSAPVMGERGIVPLSGDTLVGTLDLRWIATDVQRGSVAQDGNRAAAAPVRAAAVVEHSTPMSVGIVLAQQATPAAGNASLMPDVHAIDRDLVLDLLRTDTAPAEQTR